MLTRQAATGKVNGMIELLPIVSDDNTLTSGAWDDGFCTIPPAAFAPAGDYATGLSSVISI